MITIVGAGAFGTALALALTNGGRAVTLVARDAEQVDVMRASGKNPRLPDVNLPPELQITTNDDLSGLHGQRAVLLAIPTQSLAGLLRENRKRLSGQTLVACCKGVDLKTGVGPTDVIAQEVPDATPAILSGPSFAADIGAGLPTALTLATDGKDTGESLQKLLSTPGLRLYRTTDVAGVEVGGALKNVVAIACGAAIGAGLGESARAALMTRGYAEMTRFAATRGADPATLSGLSGLGDLALTAMSEKSRNYRFGLQVGAGDTTPTETTEGVATARAVASIAGNEGIEMPLTIAVADIIDGKTTLQNAIHALLSRPLKPE